MNFSGDVEIKTLELPDAVEFTVTRDDSIYESVVAPVVTAFVLWYIWRAATNGWPRIFVIFAAVTAVAYYIAKRIHGREITLRVESGGLAAKGNMDRLFSTTFELAAADITKIRYYTGGEGGAGGLYVWYGWANACVLPGISSDQADSIVEAIARRFPHLPTEFSSSAGWRGEKLIELGLSKLNQKDTERKF